MKRNYTIDLKGMNILVTGSSKGIGKSIASHLIDQGARVAIHYNSDFESAQELIENDNPTESILVKADLENTDDVQMLIETVLKKMGHLDVIIINAGVFIEHPIDMEPSTWMKVWNKTMDINLNSAGLMTKLGLDHFLKRNGGRFIYIGSRAVFRGETKEYLAYAASKGGLTSLGRSVARSFGKDGVKSFIVAPGFTRTQMAESFISKYG
ncbi:MAG: SDR family oxidoreductase, partial [Flavobacteriaceae bacterium]|nr:SDR family oxidoreductase [Flavobacteriaceae bacterium]